MGVVMLSKPPSEKGPFRAWVEKLLVSPSFRRRGVARKLMKKLEELGKASGRTLLVSSPYLSRCVRMYLQCLTEYTNTNNAW